ncbi:glycosyltransferase family protein, partial [Bacteroides xylanisolvens]
MKSLLFITNFYPDPQHGGIERVTNILAESFAEQGIICRCIYLYSCEVNLKWDYLPCQLISAQYDKQVYIEYIQRYNIDIIINQSNLYYSPFLREVCNVTGAKLITCLHNSTECKAQHYREAVKGALGMKKILISIG